MDELYFVKKYFLQ